MPAAASRPTAQVMMCSGDTMGTCCVLCCCCCCCYVSCGR
jgi:hypothetical protein